MPADEELRGIISGAGPLIAPSANPESMPPATTVDEAREYFGDAVKIYVDGGVRNTKPSQVIKILADGSQQELRS